MSEEGIKDATKGERVIESYTIIGLPKGTVLWPSGASAIILGLLGFIFQNSQSTFAGIWLSIFALNLTILFFDFDRGVVVGILGIVIAIVALSISFDVSLPAFDFIQRGILGASPAFLIVFGAILLLNMVVAYFMKRWFDYYVLTSNELVKKQGILGDARRYSAQNLTVDKDIVDIFESLILFGTGNLRFRAKNDVFVIENVPRINKAEKEIRKLLTKLEVDTGQG